MAAKDTAKRENGNVLPTATHNSGKKLVNKNILASFCSLSIVIVALRTKANHLHARGQNSIQKTCEIMVFETRRLVPANQKRLRPRKKCHRENRAKALNNSFLVQKRLLKKAPTYDQIIAGEPQPAKIERSSKKSKGISQLIMRGNCRK